MFWVSMCPSECWRQAEPPPLTRRSPTPGLIWRQLELPAKSFDLVYSSLALHYVRKPGGLLSQGVSLARPGEALVFSVEHPIFTAPAEPSWSLNAAGRKTWPIDGLPG